MKISRPVAIESDFWAGRRVLLTGHTGFKGAWLSLWLQSLGAEVSGLARSPHGSELYERARVGEGVEAHLGDVRDAAAIGAALDRSRAELVVHLAGQPFLQRSLRDPVATYEVNVIGTLNLLEAVRARAGAVRGVLLVTSDKCYENPPHGNRAFVEKDPLGGSDPYSSSKAAAELIASAYRRSYFGSEGTPNVATARAGNVIGGGDRGEDRLLPDARRAIVSGRPLLVRNPAAVRAWQHVLGPLAGYLLLLQSLWQGDSAARAWNFGPPPEEARSVGWILERLAELWQGGLLWQADERSNPPEAGYLALDSTAAEAELDWTRAWTLEEALERVVEWDRRERDGEDMRAVTLAQIAAYAGALTA